MKKLAVLLITFCASSCATLVTGTTDDIMVTSTPPGAFFKTSIGQQGRTPQTISLPDDEAVSIQFELEGYESQSAYVGTKMSGWVAGNLFIFPFILVGFVVDLVGGGQVHHSDHVHADLYPVKPPPAPVSRPTERQKKPPARESFEEWEERQQPLPEPEEIKP